MTKRARASGIPIWLRSIGSGDGRVGLLLACGECLWPTEQKIAECVSLFSYFKRRFHHASMQI